MGSSISFLPPVLIPSLLETAEHPGKETATIYSGLSDARAEEREGGGKVEGPYSQVTLPKRLLALLRTHHEGT